MRADLKRPIPDIVRIPVFSEASEAGSRINGRTVVCVGTFDGVHRGHQEILRRARLRADQMGVSLWILSFHPHPRSVVNSDHAPRLLTLPEERAVLFQHFGADGAVIQRFDRDFASQRPEQFLRDFVIGKLGAQAIIAGADFRFGKGREGDAEYLRTHAAALGVEAEVVELVDGSHGKKIGSEDIRNALSNSDFKTAIELLGHAYPVTGQVVPGLSKGREIGYPTWNLALPQVKLAPPVGVYAGWTFRQTPQPGMAYYGSNPTFGGHTPHLEVNILGGSAEERSPRHPTECFWLTDFVRPEVVYDNPEDLIRQLADDERTVRRRLGV